MSDPHHHHHSKSHVETGIEIVGPPLSDEIAHLPLGYDHLVRNIYVHRKPERQRKSQVMKCECKPSDDGSDGLSNCGSGCMNRLMAVECLPGICDCGDLCRNQKFRKMDYPTVEVFGAGDKGRGLRTLQNIESGDFIIEYVGEVIDLMEFRKRAVRYDQDGEGHFFFMLLDGERNEYLDATKKANHARFINHSCVPNCQTEKWTVGAETRIGIFATKDMPAGTELTFDYKFERYGTERQTCLCGEAGCRGYLGGEKEVKLKEILYEDELMEASGTADIASDDLEESLGPLYVKMGPSSTSTDTPRFSSAREDVIHLAKLLFQAHSPSRRIKLLQALHDSSTKDVRAALESEKKLSRTGIKMRMKKEIKIEEDETSQKQKRIEIQIMEMVLKVITEWPMNFVSLQTSHIYDTIKLVMVNENPEIVNNVRELATAIGAIWSNIVGLTETRVPKRKKEDIEREQQERREKEEEERRKREFEENMRKERELIRNKIKEERLVQLAEQRKKEQESEHEAHSKASVPDRELPKQYITMEELRKRREESLSQSQLSDMNHQDEEKGFYSMDIDTHRIDESDALNPTSKKQKRDKPKVNVTTDGNAILSLELRGFRDQTSYWVTHYLQQYYKRNRFASKDDFKKCARYLTHKIVENEKEGPDGMYLFHPQLRRKIGQLVKKELSKVSSGEKYDYERQREKRHEAKERKMQQKMEDGGMM